MASISSIVAGCFLPSLSAGKNTLACTESFITSVVYRTNHRLQSMQDTRLVDRLNKTHETPLLSHVHV